MSRRGVRSVGGTTAPREASQHDDESRENRAQLLTLDRVARVQFVDVVEQGSVPRLFGVGHEEQRHAVRTVEEEAPARRLGGPVTPNRVTVPRGRPFRRNVSAPVPSPSQTLS